MPDDDGRTKLIFEESDYLPRDFPAPQEPDPDEDIAAGSLPIVLPRP